MLGEQRAEAVQWTASGVEHTAKQLVADREMAPAITGAAARMIYRAGARQGGRDLYGIDTAAGQHAFHIALRHEK